LRKIHAASTPSLVSNRLRRAIQLGTYIPGDKLPPQRELASSLGVSLVTLREALRILEAEGYLVLRRGATGGAVVMESSETVEVLRLRVRERLAEFEEWMEFRVAVEAAAAGLAAGRATADEISALRASIELMRSGSEAPLFRHADSAFHLGLAEAARNEVVRQAVGDARATMFLAFDVVPHVSKVSATVRGHERVLAAVTAGNARRAETAMIAHIRTSWKEIRAMIESEPRLRKERQGG
jgi:GntR family transcriptional repressor for pyruvate dehydrogenase complex